jgi:hypothetical protein
MLLRCERAVNRVQLVELVERANFMLRIMGLLVPPWFHLLFVWWNRRGSDMESHLKATSKNLHRFRDGAGKILIST